MKSSVHIAYYLPAQALLLLLLSVILFSLLFLLIYVKFIIIIIINTKINIIMIIFAATHPTCIRGRPQLDQWNVCVRQLV